MRKPKQQLNLTLPASFSRAKKALAKGMLAIALTASVAMITPHSAVSAADCNCVAYVGSHVVQKGETMYSIAKKYGLVPEQLMDANFTDKTLIRTGQKLMIPGKNQPWHGNMDNPNDKVYVVKKGDTLYNISKRTGVSIAAIKELNKLQSDTIRIGQWLAIYPENGVKELTQITYVVKSGDTKFALKKKYGNTIQLPAGDLQTFQRLPVKGNVLQITTEQPFGLADGRVIEVRSGNSFYAINLYQGNGPIEHLAYREDVRLTFTTVRVGLRNELVSYGVKYLE